MKKKQIVLYICCTTLWFAFFNVKAGESHLSSENPVPGEPGLLVALASDIDARAVKELPTHSQAAAVSGFWETRFGIRTQKDNLQDQTSLAETRLRLNLKKSGKRTDFNFSGDLLYDNVADDHDIDLETGAGILDLREAYVHFKPLPNLDLTLGRQIIQWGTGGLLSVNDRFPKDFRSFLLGRDIEYLRAPSDAFNLNYHSKLLKLDLVYTPRFDANRFIDGSRLSFFNRGLRRLSGKQDVLQPEKPKEWFQDDEIAVRLSRKIKGFDSALYAYHGFWKGPAGFDPGIGKRVFPELRIIGASTRGRLGPGRTRLEIGHFNSLQDRDGNNPFIRNSEARFRLGYKTRFSKQTAMGIQYFLERKLDHNSNRQPAEDENRHVFSTRVIHKLKHQKTKLTLIAFYSPSDEDGYLRPIISHGIHQDWIVGGANVFFGESENTFFGQLENNSNLYFGIRYSFGAKRSKERQI